MTESPRPHRVSQPTRRALVLLVGSSMLVTSACHLIKVNGKPLSAASQPKPKAAPAPSRATTTSSSPSVEPQPKPGASPAEVWHSIHYSHIQDGEYPRQFFDRTKLLSAREVSILPESISLKWMPKWKNTSRAKRPAAFLRSAISRSWEPDCHQEFERFTKQWKQLLRESKKELAFVGSTKNYYAGRNSLIQVKEKFLRSVDSSELSLPRQHPYHWSFGWNELVKAELRLRKNAGVETLASWALPRSMYEETRPLPSNLAVAREGFCVAARNTGTARLVAMPSIAGAYGGALSTSAPAEQERANAYVRESRDWLRKHHNDPRSKNIAAGYIPVERTGRDGDKAQISGDVVRRVVKQGKGAVVRLEEMRYQDVRSNCRMTNRVAQIHRDGRVEYQQNCRVKTMKQKLTIDVQFSSLPKVGLKKGDKIWAYGLRVSKAQKSKGVVFKVQGQHIVGIERAGSKLKLYR